MRTFAILERDAGTKARTGLLRTRRGIVRTPAFMPVGTQASVKSLAPEEIRATGSEIILANTYHLLLRPGPTVFEIVGDLHSFMGWDGPILTDSGGFQVYSLAKLRSVSENGVTFRSHIDGSLHELTPERAIDLQLLFGSDIIMPLDDVVGYGEPEHRQREAMERTHCWLQRAIARFAARTAQLRAEERPLLFGIAQGGFAEQRRRESAAFIASLPVDGIAIGGLSVGEPKDLLTAMLRASLAELPEDRPRYLMGVGAPEDLWYAVGLGVDLFDCVLPTRLARHGALFTEEGRIDITSGRYKFQREPVDAHCDCYTCQRYSAAYLHHLFRAKELLAYRLASIHNIRFIQNQMARMRAAIAAGTFARAMEAFFARYRSGDSFSIAVAAPKEPS
ncbi:MAG: tRNA guanosine(34) transglycosylase Tgt [Thermomicrobium sp.]|nr:tRNA guanosine(34) transglycosylase Tgt [Thermomicrobium sp.]MDW8058977.1 tRNA guanosine(34) transglycosylase Tgt [Thermomicrobium sp.]